MVANEQEQAEARYEIRHPQVADYGRLNAERVNELGDFVDEIKAECHPSGWFEEAIKRAKPKRSVAHDRFSYDADAALHRVQRDEARILFSQFIPVAHVEELGRGFELPPASPTIRVIDRDAEEEVGDEDGERKYKREQVDWFGARDDPELRKDLMRQGVKHIMGYMSWVRDFDEMKPLVKEMRKAARIVGLT